MEKNEDEFPFEGERDFLYKFLFELRGNINELCHSVRQMEKRLDELEKKQAQTPVMPPYSRQVLEDVMSEVYVEPERELDYLNLSDIGRQMLVKVLQRNNGNRKLAAQELGISDRTMYRRLKQYGLE